jgi:hypothetical protein
LQNCSISIVILTLGAVVLLCPARVQAQQLNLTVSPLLVTFPATDPDTAPVLSAPPVTVEYRVRGNGNRPWLLTVQASGNLTSGLSQIPASAVTWIATPAPPFQSGTMSTTQAQTVAAGSGNVNPARTGTITFQLANSWNYDAGLYLQVLTFTLSTP